jgi:transcriptional antiterminator NusG
MQEDLFNWYVIQTKAGDEEKIKEKVDKLKIENLKTFLPKRKLLLRKKGKFFYALKALYPGYFFVNFKFEPSIVKKLKKIQGLIKILSNKNGIPKQVPPNEMSLIFSLTSENEIILPSEAFFVNDKIKIISGPLLGLEGQITAVDKRKKRVKVKLPFFNSFKEVYLSYELVEKI